jgi:tRNA synthetases class II (A)
MQLIALILISSIALYRSVMIKQSQLHKLSTWMGRVKPLRMCSTDSKWPVEKVRSKFVEYFESKHAHINYRSSPVVPVNDPTLLFANSGMNQFKPIFVGTVDPTSPLADLTRAVNSQKCIRAGGKHNGTVTNTSS